MEDLVDPYLLEVGVEQAVFPEEHCLFHSDFQEVGIDKIFHYSLSTGPPQGKLEPHGHLARSWPTFEEQAVFMAGHFCDVYGTEYHDQLVSQDLDLNGKPVGFLFILKDLHLLLK